MSITRINQGIICSSFRDKGVQDGIKTLRDNSRMRARGKEAGPQSGLFQINGQNYIAKAEVVPQSKFARFFGLKPRTKITITTGENVENNALIGPVFTNPTGESSFTFSRRNGLGKKFESAAVKLPSQSTEAQEVQISPSNVQQVNEQKSSFTEDIRITELRNKLVSAGTIKLCQTAPFSALIQKFKLQTNKEIIELAGQLGMDTTKLIDQLTTIPSGQREF